MKQKQQENMTLCLKDLFKSCISCLITIEQNCFILNLFRSHDTKDH